jgi:hypothetical protein
VAAGTLKADDEHNYLPFGRTEHKYEVAPEQGAAVEVLDRSIRLTLSHFLSPRRPPPFCDEALFSSPFSFSFSCSCSCSCSRQPTARPPSAHRGHTTSQTPLFGISREQRFCQSCHLLCFDAFLKHAARDCSCCVPVCACARASGARARSRARARSLEVTGGHWGHTTLQTPLVGISRQQRFHQSCRLFRFDAFLKHVAAWD